MPWQKKKIAVILALMRFCCCCLSVLPFQFLWKMKEVKLLFWLEVHGGLLSEPQIKFKK